MARFRRGYRRAYSPLPHAMCATGTPYWENEIPTGGAQGIQIGNYVVKHYVRAGKMQTYAIHAGHLSHGVTLSLDTMTGEELEALRALFNATIDAEQGKRVAAAPVRPVIGTPPMSVAPKPADEPMQPAADLAKFKSLLASVCAKTAAVSAGV
jgi:hypothetical protein